MSSANEFDRRLLLGAAGLAGAAALSRIAAAGPLDPPSGPVTSTGKTLTEIEPRTAITAANTPGNSGATFRITQPGSYYLTANLVGQTGRSGIVVEAANVTIDLNGFVLQGVASALNGIALSTTGVRIRNGTIAGWGQAGIAAPGTQNNVYEDLIVFANGGRGIDGNDNARVARCSIRNNTGLGLRVGNSSLVESCTIQSNTGGGAEVLSGSTLTGCSVAFNGGVSVLTGGVGAIVRGNTVHINGANAVGIRVAGTDGCIDRNTVIGTAQSGMVGLQLAGGAVRNTVRGNTVMRCTDNHSLQAGNLLEIVISELPEVLDVSCSATLAGSLTGVSGQPGITIAADGVTIDLAGHALIGVPGAHDGITVPAARRDLAVRNGSVRSWPRNGVNFENSTGAIIENIRASQNTFGGIVANNDARIINCTASANVANNILVQGANAFVSGCTANNSVSGAGIFLAVGYGFIKDCVTRDNNQSGIRFLQRTRVQDCHASNNQQHGIHGNFGGQISGCFCTQNRVCGIFSDDGGGIDIIGNSCLENGGSAAGAGIRTRFGLQRIENNNLAVNHRGIDVLGGGNIIMRNTAISNSNGNYVIVGGNTVGPIVSGDPATAGNANHPMVNYQY